MIEEQCHYYLKAMKNMEDKIFKKLINLYNFYYAKATDDYNLTYNEGTCEFVTLDEMSKNFELTEENKLYLNKIKTLNKILTNESKVEEKTIEGFLGKETKTFFTEVNFSKETKKYLKKEFIELKIFIKNYKKTNKSANFQLL